MAWRRFHARFLSESGEDGKRKLPDKFFRS
jgi:hypothetical protein